MVKLRYDFLIGSIFIMLFLMILCASLFSYLSEMFFLSDKEPIIKIAFRQKKKSCLHKSLQEKDFTNENFGSEKSQWKRNLLSPIAEKIFETLSKQFSWKKNFILSEQLRKLSPSQPEKELIRLHYIRLIEKMVFVLLLILFISGGVLVFCQEDMQLKQGRYLERAPIGGNSFQVEIEAEAEGEKKEMTISVLPQQYTKEQIRSQLINAKEYITNQYLGQNISPDAINKPLNLVKVIPDSNVKIQWKLDRKGIVNEDGSLNRTEISENTEVEISAILTCGETEETILISVVILPKEKTTEEIFWEKWQEKYIQNQKQSESEKYLELPDEIDEKSVSYKEEVTDNRYILIVFLFLVMAFIPKVIESRMKGKIEQREKQLVRDYPEFIERFVLLIGAGLTVSGAWQKITYEYRQRKEGDKRRYLYEEMIVTQRDIENGMGEMRAYELFGKRVGLLPYIKFSTLLIQNLRKGNADLLRVLEFESVDAMRSRQENAKVLGAEASTKLLLPMMLMLLIVFGIILYAAFQSM